MSPNRINRRQVLGGLAATTGLAACAHAPFASAAVAGTRPNIIFIMADDLGYADLSCFGRRDFSTPNLDRLAGQGLQFTSAYSNSPVCSATRTALMTGQYQYRLPIGLEEPLIPARNEGLPAGKPTLASMLKSAGYSTSLIGKWHLGRLPDFGPLQSGYDHFWGFRGPGVDYFNHSDPEDGDLWDGDQRIEEVGYITDLLADRTIEQLDDFSKSSEPFLISLHFSAPHWPWEGPNDQAEADRISSMPGHRAIHHYDGGTLATYAEMVTRMDMQVGRVLAKLKELGLDQNTIIVFTSDNGGERFSDTWPFSGRKSEVLEGGIRVPTMMRWPSRIAPGQKTDIPTMTMDWVPTLLAAAGQRAEDLPVEFDGVDISASFDGQALPDRALFWRFKHMDQKAVRLGRWKYLHIAGNEFLFDVIADPLERGNLKDREVDVFEDLKARFSAWDADMLPYEDDTFSGGFTGSEMADRFGVEPRPRR